MYIGWDFEKAAFENGEVTIDGVRYVLVRPVHLEYDSDVSGLVYQANAVTSAEEDSRYIITWEIVNPDCDDKNCTCDWDRPFKIWDRYIHKVVYMKGE